eukprot:6456604-Amphidinium_carterae.1
METTVVVFQDIWKFTLAIKNKRLSGDLSQSLTASCATTGRHCQHTSCSSAGRVLACPTRSLRMGPAEAVALPNERLALVVETTLAAILDPAEAVTNCIAGKLPTGMVATGLMASASVTLHGQGDRQARRLVAQPACLQDEVFYAVPWCVLAQGILVEVLEWHRLSAKKGPCQFCPSSGPWACSLAFARCQGYAICPCAQCGRPGVRRLPSPEFVVEAQLSAVLPWVRRRAHVRPLNHQLEGAATELLWKPKQQNLCPPYSGQKRCSAGCRLKCLLHLG